MDHLTLDQLLDYSDERLPADQAKQVAAHLASCPACRAELASLQQLTTVLAEDNWITPPDSARAAVQNAFRRRHGAATPQALPLATLGSWLRGFFRPRWQPALALALLLIIAAAAVALYEPPATVYAASAAVVSGTVETKDAGEATWTTIAEGSTLQAGDLLRTAADGSLLLTFPGGSSASVAPNSTLALTALQETPRTIVLDLRRGESQVHATLPGEPQARFEVSTPAATITGAAADFRLTVDDSGTTFVDVESGDVTVAAAASALALGAGEEALVNAGEPPQLLTEEPTRTPSPTPTATSTPTPTTTPSPTQVTSTPTPTPTDTIAPPPTPTSVAGDDDGTNGDDHGGGDDSSGVDDSSDDAGGDDHGDDTGDDHGDDASSGDDHGGDGTDDSHEGTDDHSETRVIRFGL